MNSFTIRSLPSTSSKIATVFIFNFPAPLRPLIAARTYATQTGVGTTGAPQPRRKTVTAFNDDGRIAWGNLSTGEKVARTTQQSFNFSLIAAGILMTAGVAYLMYTEVFSLDSKTAHFNRAVNQVKKDPRCLELLGDSKKIVAHGQGQVPKGWRHDRKITANITKDRYNVEHLLMNIAMEGPLNNGLVCIHMIKKPSDSEFNYKYMYLDVKGHQRIYLENADAVPDSPSKSETKLFGINWR